MTRDQDTLLLRLFQSTALLKYNLGRLQEWTFADACSFLGITEDMKDNVLDAQLDYLHGNLVDIEWQLRGKGAESDTLSDGRAITADDVSVLYDIYNEMLALFGRHLATLQWGEVDDAGSQAAVLEDGRVTREQQDKLLQSLLQSTALLKFQEGRKQDWTFADACRFWGITENMQGDVLDAQLDQVGVNLAHIERQLGPGAVTLSDGRSISADEIRMLLDIHTQMHTRFSRHLTLLRSRTIRD
jgi:hypothetical protein